MKLNDTHLVLLSAASQRDNGLVTPPETMTTASARKAMAALLKADLVAEVPVSTHVSHWREDDEGRPVGLRITAAGLSAIGLDAGEGDECAGTLDRTSADGWDVGCEVNTQPAAPAPAKAGTKRALVLNLLGRPEGATLADLTAATGWLPHTTRAALTGLRQAGHAITRGSDEAGRSAYRIETTPAATGEA